MSCGSPRRRVGRASGRAASGRAASGRARSSASSVAAAGSGPRRSPQCWRCSRGRTARSSVRRCSSISTSTGGGIDVVLGIESVPGARWSGLRVDGGHLDPARPARRVAPCRAVRGAGVRRGRAPRGCGRTGARRSGGDRSGDHRPAAPRLRRAFGRAGALRRRGRSGPRRRRRAGGRPCHGVAGSERYGGRGGAAARRGGRRAGSRAGRGRVARRPARPGLAPARGRPRSVAASCGPGGVWGAGRSVVRG